MEHLPDSLDTDFTVEFCRIECCSTCMLGIVIESLFLVGENGGRTSVAGTAIFTAPDN